MRKVTTEDCQLTSYFRTVEVLPTTRFVPKTNGPIVIKGQIVANGICSVCPKGAVVFEGGEKKGKRALTWLCETAPFLRSSMPKVCSPRENTKQRRQPHSDGVHGRSKHQLTLSHNQKTHPQHSSKWDRLGNARAGYIISILVLMYEPV